jgi:hypothetical protein
VLAGPASRFHLHFAPTLASWANAVEGFFAQLTTRRLRRGAFHSSLELHNAIDTSLAWHNANPKRSSGPSLSTPSSTRSAGQSKRWSQYTSFGWHPIHRW